GLSGELTPTFEMGSAEVGTVAEGRAGEAGPLPEGREGEGGPTTEGRAGECGLVTEDRVAEDGCVAEGRGGEGGLVTEGCAGEGAQPPKVAPVKKARPGLKASGVSIHSTPRHLHFEKFAESPNSNPEKSIPSLGGSEKPTPEKVT